MMENKKIIYLNQGSTLPDYLCTGVSRAYLEGDNLIIVLESKSGVENENEEYINEVTRLIIPLSYIEKVGANFSNAFSYASSSNKLEEKKQGNDQRMQDSNLKDKKERLGKPLL